MACLNLFTKLSCGFLMAWAGERVQRFLAKSALSGSYFGLRTVVIAEKILSFKSGIKVNTSAAVMLAALIYFLDRCTPSSVFWGTIINIGTVVHAMTAAKLYYVMFSFLEPLRQPVQEDGVSLYMYQLPPPLMQRFLGLIFKWRVRARFVHTSPREVHEFTSFIPVLSGQGHRSCPSVAECTSEALEKIEEAEESKFTVMESSQQPTTSNHELSGPPVVLDQSGPSRHKDRRRGPLPAAVAPMSSLFLRATSLSSIVGPPLERSTRETI